MDRVEVAFWIIAALVAALVVSGSVIAGGWPWWSIAPLTVGTWAAGASIIRLFDWLHVHP